MGNLIIYLFLALVISFLCSILEAVLLSVSLSYIDSLEKKNNENNSLLKKLKTNIDRPIAAILTVNTIAHTIGAAGVGAESAKVFGEQYMFIVSSILTLLILYFSEIISKTIGALYWRKLANPSARIINILIYLTYPLVVIAEFTTKLFSNGEKITISREELLANALLSEIAGEINESESDIIENTLDLSNTVAKDIFTPRSVMFALEKNMLVKEAISTIDQLRTFSRIPIYDLDIDHVVGKVLSKDILWNNINEENIPLHSFQKKISSVDENTPVSKILSKMIAEKEQLFVVTDSFGQTAGVISMEDCLETLLGKEIMDESDRVEDLQELAKKFLRKND